MIVDGGTGRAVTAASESRTSLPRAEDIPAGPGAPLTGFHASDPQSGLQTASKPV